MGRALACLSLWIVGNAVAYAAPPRSFSPVYAPSSCVELVRPEAFGEKLTGGTIRVQRISGAVHVADFAGNYDRGLTAPRAELATQVLQATGHDVDFLVVFTDFEFATGDALAFYQGIRNDVVGIGLPQVDYSQQFGSRGRLQGYIDMAAMSRYSLNSRDPAFRLPLNVLSHELMHRWGIQVRFLGADGQPSSELLGRDGAHWSLLADTAASVMYGGRWQAELDGGFRLVEARERLSRWDLYLAGFAAPEEVPPMRLLRGTGLDPTELPLVGTRALGSAVEIAIDQVVAVEGVRQPSAERAQREFTAALVLLVRPEQTIDEAKLAQLQRFAQRFETYFQAITEGRASLRFLNQRPVSAIAGTPALPVGSSPLRHADPVSAGLAWLKQQQNEDGSFADRPSTAVRDTSAVLRTIQQVEPSWPGSGVARQFLAGHSPTNEDDRLRIAGALPAPIGGLPADALVSGWRESSYDLALSAALDADAGLFDTIVKRNLLDRLLGQQISHGGFASVGDGAARLRASLLATRALLAFWPDDHPGAERARIWVLEQLLQLPLQGAQSAGTSELADALLIAGELRLPESLRLRLRSALESRQGERGDWGAGIYTTAVASLAIARLSQPDLEVVSVAVSPEAPMLGEPVTLRARVRNGGGVATPEVQYRWSREQPESSGVFVPIASGLLPVLIPGESIQVEVPVETQGWPVLNHLQLEVDADNVLIELSEEDNHAELSVQLSAPGSSIDLALIAGEHSLNPVRFQRIGDTVSLSGQVRNLGGGAAQQALLRLERLQSGARRVLAESRIDLPAASQVPYALAFTIEAGGDHVLELSIDPVQESGDERRDNNVLRLQLPAEPGVDLAIQPASLTLQPATPSVGADLRIAIDSLNLGNSLAGATSIELRLAATDGVSALQRRPLQVQAAATANTVFNWRPTEPGTHRLQIVIDPEGLVDEFDKSNNAFEFEINAVRSDGVDLAVSPGSTRATPAQPLQGRPLQLAAELVNQGGQASGAYTVALYLGDPRSGGLRLAATPGPQLEPGSAAAITIALEEFPGRGDVSLFLVVDSDLEILEVDEDNNFGIVDTIARAAPDAGISPQAVAVEPEVPLPGLQVSVRATVSNRGEQPTDPMRAHLFELRRGEPHLVAAAVEVPALDPGADFDAVWQWVATAEGVEALLIQLDPERAVADGDRSNNELSVPLISTNDGGFALTPVFSPNGDGIRDRGAAVFPWAPAELVSVDVRDDDDRTLVRLQAFDELPGGRSLAWWDGMDARAMLSPDGAYRLVAMGEAGRTLDEVRVTLDTDRPMALASVLSSNMATRRLPESINPWLTPPAGSPVEDYLYTWGNEANPGTSLKRGIARTHAMLGGVEPVLSARWLAQNVNGAPVTSLLIEPSLGRAVVFTANGRVWTQDADSLDQPQLVAELPSDAQSAQVVGFGGQHVAYLQHSEDGMRSVFAVALETGVVNLLASADNHSILKTYAAGVLMGRPDPTVSGGEVPQQFIPLDPVAAPVELGLDQGLARDCFARFALAGDEPALFWHVLGADGELIQWISLQTGESRSLFERAPSGCPVSSGSSSNPWLTKRTGPAGFAEARMIWLDALNRVALVDHSGGTVQLIDAHGIVRGEQAFRVTERAELYAEIQGLQPNGVIHAEPVGQSAVCPVSLHPANPSQTGDERLGRASYNPWNREYYFAAGEVVLDRMPDANSSSSGRQYAFACAGVTEYLAISIDTGELRRIAGRTTWPLQGAEDRSNFHLVAGTQGTVQLPAELPRFFQQGGVFNRIDARIQAGSQVGARPWSASGRLLRSVHDETRLHIEGSAGDDRVASVISSLDRMRSLLRASSNGRSVTFTGFATDENLDYYQIDYANAAAPENWYGVVPPRREQVRGDQFMTWAPPQSGAYLFRLRVVDRAGNRLDSHASAELVFSSPISAVRLDLRDISPNGDGSKEAVTLDFNVTRPTELGLRVVDTAGRAVFTSDRSFGAGDLGAQQWVWNGHDNQGVVVPDGLYRIELSAGFAFPIGVDTVFPTIGSASLTPSYPPTTIPAARVFDVRDRRGSADLTSELELYLESRSQSDTGWTRNAPNSDGGFDAVRLPWLSLSNARHRWVAEDRAGNRTYAELPHVDPVLHIIGPSDLLPVRADSWQDLPFLTTTMRAIPEHRFIVPFPPVTTVLLPLADQPILFRAEYEEPRPVVLDISRIGDASELDRTPVRWAALVEALPIPLGEGLFQLNADLSGIGVGDIVAMRVRERTAQGVRVSNAMRFNTPDPVLTCNPEIPGWDLSVLLPRAAERAELVASWPTGQRPDIILPGLREATERDGVARWSFVGGSSMSAPQLRLRLWFAGQADALTLSSLRVMRCPNPPDGGLPDDGTGLALKVSPQSSGSCGGGISNGILAWPSIPDRFRRFRLELEDPRELDPVVLAQGLRSELGSAPLPVSTLGLPGAEGVLKLHAEDSQGVWYEAEAEFPIDRTPPIVQITAPAPGSRVCAVRGGVNGIDAVLHTDSRAVFALDSASLVSSELRYQTLRCNQSDDDRDCLPLDEQPLSSEIDLRMGSFSERVLRLPDDRVSDGSVSFRARALDWSGAQTCATTTVHVDASVEVDERRTSLPAPRGSSAPVIAPPGDSELRSVSWFFQARESVQVRAEIYPTVAVGSAASLRFRIEGLPLAMLVEGAQSVGDFDIDWDGRLQGVNAPDGVYGMRLHALDACGHEREFDRFVRVDSTPPALEIHSPQEAADLRHASIQVVGTVQDSDPGAYEVAVSTTGAQGPWQQLAEGQGNVSAPRALGVLQRQGLNGQVWLQLSARDRVGNASALVRRINLLPRPDVLASARLSHSLISPNGDGRLDTLELRLVLARDALLDVDLLGPSGQMLIRLAASQAVAAGPLSLPWGAQHDPALMPDDVYRLRVRAIDAALGGEPDEAELDFLIDTQAPELLWSPVMPAVLSCDDPPELSVEDGQLAEYRAELRNDAGVLVREIAGMAVGSYGFGAFGQLPEGPYRLTAEALDAAGNRSEADAEFTLDCTPPELSLLAPEADSVLARVEGTQHRVAGRVQDSNPRSFRLELVSDNDPSGRLVLLDQPQQTEPEFGFAWAANVTDGSFQLELTAEDHAGNLSTLSIPIHVDGTPPLAQLHTPAEGEVVRAGLDITATATDTNFESLELLTATPAEAARGDWSSLLRSDTPVDAGALPAVQGLPQGERLFRLQVRDRAGLSAEAERRLTIDSEAPPAPIELAASIEDGANVRLGWRGGEAPDLAGFHVHRITGNTIDRITADPLPQRQYLDLDLAEGRWTYEVVAVDHVGNESAPSNRIEVRIDRTPPEALIIQPAPGERVRGTLSVHGTAASTDDFERYELAVLDESNAQLRLLRESGTPVRAALLGQWDTREAADGAVVRFRLRAWDRSGNRAEVIRSVEVDNAPPLAPQGLTGELQGADLGLHWLPNSEPDLLGYLLYRNGRLLTAGASLPADLRPLALAQNAYVDAAVPDGEHVYRVYAIDTAGNLSPPSAPFTPELELGPPSTELLRPDEGTVFDQPIEVLAQTEHGDVAEIAFFARAAGETTWTALGEPVRSPPWRQVFDPSGRPFGDYELQAVATDDGGLSDPQPPSVRVRHDDITPPPAPDGVQARADGHEVRVSWSASEGPDLDQYRLERFDLGSGWQESSVHPAATRSGIDPDRPLGAHRYRVLAVDASGNRSEPSDEVEAEVFAIDLHPLPHTPTAAPRVIARGKSPRMGEVLLQRQLGADLEELPGAAVLADQSFSVEAELLPGQNVLRASVRDPAENRSLRAEILVTHGRTPRAPEGLQGAVNGDQVTINWQPVVGAVGYRVYRNGSPVASDLPLAQTINAQSNGVPVSAVLDGDAATVWSEQPSALSDQLRARLELHWSAPVLVGGLELDWNDVEHSARDFDVFGWYDGRWNLLSEVRNQSGASYRLTLSTAYPTQALLLVPLRSQWPGSSHALAEVRVLARNLASTTNWSERVGDGRHRYSVAALSPLGFESAASAEWIAEVGDATPPQAVVLSGSVDGRDALLSWTAADAPDLSRYRLLRNGSLIAEIAAGDAREYRDTNLPNGPHRYMALAEDAVGNLSAPSNEVLIEISGDAPGVPVITRATPQLDAPAMELHWRAGQGVVPARFRLFASASADDPADPYREIARPETSPWLHVGLSYGLRLYYRIQAEDAAGNLSALSPPFEAHVRDLRTPTAPSITWPALAPDQLEWAQARYRVCGVAEAGRGIELRVNGQIASSDVAAPVAQIMPAMELARGYLNSIALSPDGSRLAWIDDQGRVHERSLVTGEVRQLPVQFCCSLEYSRDGGVLGGIDVSRSAWTTWSENGGVRQVALLDHTFAALDLGESRGWLAAGRSESAGEGLWWFEDPLGQPVRIGLDASPYFRGIVAAQDGQSIYLLSYFGELYRWVVGATQADLIALDGWGYELRAGATGAVMLLESGASGSRVLRVDLDQPELVLDGLTSADSFAPSADGLGFWVLSSGALQRYDLAGNAPLEVLPLDPAQYPTALLATQAGTLVAAAPDSNAFVQIVHTAGAWCSSEIGASTGLNSIVAVASNDAGVRSALSPQLDLNFDGAVAQLPDLTIGSADLRLLPSPGVAGQPHSLVLEVRNAGYGLASDFDVQIDVTDPQGASSAHVRRASLAPGERALLSLSLGLVQEGEYRVNVELDSEGRINELSEANNRTQAVLRVHTNAEPQLELRANLAELAPGQAFEGRVAVTVASAFSGRVELWIADQGGALVTRLADIETGGLTSLAPWSRPWNWLPQQGLQAGTYRLHARLRDTQGAARAEQSLDLSVQARADIALNLQPSVVELPTGQPLAISFGMDVASANSPVEGGQLRLLVERADGSQSVLWSGSTGALSSGYRLRRNLNWATAGEIASELRLRLEFTAPGHARELSRDVRLLPPAEQPSLYGELGILPAPAMALGQPAQLAYRVGNRGPSAIDAQAIRVQVLDESGQQALILDQRVVNLTAGQALAFELDLAALPQRPTQYTAVLEAEGDTGWRPLAQLGLQSTDVEPPLGELLAPAEGQPVRTPASVEAAIRDRHSRVDFAEYSVNGAPWRSLPGAGERFSSLLGPLPDGEHQLALRAQDVWGNRWQIPPRTVLVDNTPPLIDIQGVLEGEHYPTPVAPVFTAQDLHLAQVRGWDNGVQFESAAAITVEGLHRIEVHATDAAGNRAQRELTFVLDFTPPSLSFIAPVQGAQVTVPAVSVELATEPGARVELQVGPWQTSAQADAEGRALVSAVPLQPGVNQIQAEALDRAGNRSPSVILQVTRVQQGGELVGRVDLPGPTLARGEVLDVLFSLHNQTAESLTGEAVLRVQSASGAMLAERRQPVLLEAGAQQSWPEQLVTLDWPLGALGVQLLFDDGTGESMLASAGLDLLDRQAPQLRVLQPASGALLGRPISLQIEASDDDVLTEVSYRLGQGSWTPLVVGTPPLFAVELQLADAPYTLETRAIDRSGNLTAAAPIAFAVDATPPEIILEGVADEGLYGEPVRPSARMADAHPGALVMTLNGAPFVSGSVLDVSGQYRLHVRATDQLGQVSERQIDFELDLEPVTLQLLSPEEGAILSSDRVDLLGQTKPRAQVSVQGPLSSHQAQADATGGFRIQSVGLNSGANTLSVRAVDALGRPSAELLRNVRVDTSGQQGLQGQLETVDEIAVDQPWSLAAVLRETLGQPRGPLDARVVLERADQPPFEIAWSASLPANTQQPRELTPPAQTALGVVHLRLQVRLDGVWVELAQRSLAVVDRTAPELALLSPAASSYHRGEIELQAQASDVHGEVVSVQARIEGGGWTKLQRAGANASAWGGRVQPADEGSALIELRAQDKALNWSPILQRSVFHDRTPPEIDISGVSANGLYRERVRIHVSASDASPIDLQLQLDGEPFVSGEWVEIHGRHALSARATDAAGNLSTVELAFEIDLQAPDVVIVAPTPSAVLRSEETQVLGHTEAAARVELRVHELERSLLADAQGQFRFDRVPLRIGMNRLQVRATDLAGNTGPWAEVDVERRGGFALRGVLQAPAELTIGGSLPIRVQVWNDAAHPQPEVQLRLLARDGRGSERLLDARRHSFAATGALEYALDPTTTGWPVGTVTLRLLAADDVEVQLADARVQLRAPTGVPPALGRPQQIPIDRPLTLVLLVLALIGVAIAALRRRRVLL